MYHIHGYKDKFNVIEEFFVQINVQFFSSLKNAYTLIENNTIKH